MQDKKEEEEEEDRNQGEISNMSNWSASKKRDTVLPSSN